MWKVVVTALYGWASVHSLVWIERDRYLVTGLAAIFYLEVCLRAPFWQPIALLLFTVCAITNIYWARCLTNTQRSDAVTTISLTLLPVLERLETHIAAAWIACVGRFERVTASVGEALADFVKWPRVRAFSRVVKTMCCRKPPPATTTPPPVSTEPIVATSSGRRWRGCLQTLIQFVQQHWTNLCQDARAVAVARALDEAIYWIGYNLLWRPLRFCWIHCVQPPLRFIWIHCVWRSVSASWRHVIWPLLQKLGKVAEWLWTHIIVPVYFWVRRFGRRGLTVRNFTLGASHMRLRSPNIVTDETSHSGTVAGLRLYTDNVAQVWLHNGTNQTAQCHLFVDGQPHRKIIRVPALECVSIPLTATQTRTAVTITARFVSADVASQKLRPGSDDVFHALVPDWYRDCLLRERGATRSGGHSSNGDIVDQDIKTNDKSVSEEKDPSLDNDATNNGIKLRALYEYSLTSAFIQLTTPPRT
jgi:hypothetical protein